MQWNFNRNSYVFIQENAFENVACKMAGILSRPRCVNSGEDICTVTWYILEDQIYKVRPERASLICHLTNKTRHPVLTHCGPKLSYGPEIFGQYWSMHCFVACSAQNHHLNTWCDIVNGTTRGPFYKHGLTLIPSWISNYTHYNPWEEITYPFLWMLSNG